MTNHDPTSHHPTSHDRTRSSSGEANSPSSPLARLADITATNRLAARRHRVEIGAAGPLRAVVYLRCGQVSDVFTRLTAAAQAQTCRDYVQSREWRHVAVFDDTAVSVWRDLEQRPGISQLRARVGQFDVLVVFSLDRLSRDVGELMRLARELADQGVQIASVTDSINPVAAPGAGQAAAGGASVPTGPRAAGVEGAGDAR